MEIHTMRAVYTPDLELNDINEKVKLSYGIKYSDITTPTIEQMMKCSDYEPIDTGSNEYKKCFDFFSEKNTYGICMLVSEFLSKIYYLANLAIFNDVADNTGHIAKWHFQKEFFDNPESYSKKQKSRMESHKRHSGSYKSRINDKKYVLENIDMIVLPEQSICIDQITSIMNNVHKKLNPRKPTVVNTSNSGKNIMDIFYYSANHLVELSHDILYAIGKKIDEYKENPNLYKFDEFRHYVEHDVIIPSYQAMTRLYNEVFVTYIINNMHNMIIKTDIKKSNRLMNLLNDWVISPIKRFFHKYDRHLIYSYFGSKLYQEIYEKEQIIAKKIQQIFEETEPIISKFKLKNSYIINKHIATFDAIWCNYEFDNTILRNVSLPDSFHKIPLYDIMSNLQSSYFNKTIDIVKNDELVQDINNRIRATTVDAIIKNNKKYIDINNTDSFMRSLPFIVGQITKEDVNNEWKKFKNDMEDFNKQIKILDNKLAKIDCDTIDATYNYVNAIKESLDGYTKYI